MIGVLLTLNAERANYRKEPKRVKLMKILIECCDKTLRIIPQGDIDEHTVKTIREKVDAKLKKAACIELIVFDLGKVSFMDSSGIGMILGRYNLISERGGKIGIVNAGKSIDKLLKMSGIYSLKGYERKAK